MPDAEIIPLGTRGRPGRGTGRDKPSSSSRDLWSPKKDGDQATRPDEPTVEGGPGEDVTSVEHPAEQAPTVEGADHDAPGDEVPFDEVEVEVEAEQEPAPRLLHEPRAGEPVTGPADAAIAALAVYGAAGREAALRCGGNGPGHLPAELCDALHGADQAMLERHATIRALVPA